VRGFCEYPWTQFNITADGRVSKCCADFYFSDPMGDINNDSIMSIWHGERLEKVRRLLLKGNRDAIETCRKCDFYGVRRFHSTFAEKLRSWTV
jgi:radical SAM protein with 4Fe4S-binding SPASM domain